MDPRLLDAARKGDTSELHALLNEDSVIVERGSLADYPENALHIAALAGHTDFAKEIMTKKPELAKRLNKDGFSPIHMASANGHTEIVKKLLEINSELGLFKSSDGRTPLHFAATTGSTDAIRSLLLKCPESARELTIGLETALHLAVKNNQFEAFRVMVEVLEQRDFFKELLNAKDEEGNTVLYIATSKQQRQTIRLLLGGDVRGKVEVNIENESGLRALDCVSDQSSSNKEIKELLQGAGAVRTRANNNSPGLPPQGQSNRPKWEPSQYPWKFWKVLAKEVEGSSKKSQNALMVVAILITTVTYQALLNPPGGFQPPDTPVTQSFHAEGYAHRVGQRFTGVSLMSLELQIFIPVMVLNSIGFFTSLGMIVLLTRRSPLKVLLRLSVLSMAAIYVCIIFYIAPTNFGTSLVAALLMVAVVLGYFIHFTRRLTTTVQRVEAEAV